MISVDCADDVYSGIPENLNDLVPGNARDAAGVGARVFTAAGVVIIWTGDNYIKIKLAFIIKDPFFSIVRQSDIGFANKAVVATLFLIIQIDKEGVIQADFCGVVIVVIYFHRADEKVTQTVYGVILNRIPLIGMLVFFTRNVDLGIVGKSLSRSSIVGLEGALHSPLGMRVSVS